MSKATWTVGFHAVSGLLASGRPVELVLVQQGRHDRRMGQIIEMARQQGVLVDLVPRSRLNAIAEGMPHNGCAARAAPVAYQQLESLIAPDGEPGRLLLLDHVSDPHNLGAVIRTAAAFGVDGMIVAGPNAPPLAGALARAAAGQLERVAMARHKVAGDVLVKLHNQGYWALGAAAGGAPVTKVRPVDRWVLCLGSEERGLRAKTRKQIDEWVAIPMAPGVESLNLSVASGVLLYELTCHWPS
jgi:23S rRNA (guanosine2251-2'-O)-methyltransferase